MKPGMVYELLFSILIGFAASLSAIGFYMLVNTYTDLIGLINDLNPAIRLALLLISLNTGFILVYRFPRIRGAGADDALQAYHLYEARVKPLDLFLKALATTLFFGSSIPVGLIGPTIFIGSGVASLFTYLGRTTFVLRRKLFLSGVAGALAAVTRAPLGAFFYTLEFPYRKDLETQILLPALVSSVIGYATSLYIVGASPASMDLVYGGGYDPYIIVLVILVGLLIGYSSRIYSRIYRFSMRMFSINRIGFIPIMLIYSAILSVLYLFLPLGLDRNFEHIYRGEITHMDLGLYLALLLVFIIYLFLIPSMIGGGASGGLFAPALIIGLLYATIIYYPLSLFIGWKYYKLFLVTGMVSFYGGISGAPIGTALIVAGATGNCVLIPLLIPLAIIIREIIGGDYLYMYQRGRKILPVIQRLRDLYEELILRKPALRNARLTRFRNVMVKPEIYNYDEYCRDPDKVYRLLILPNIYVIAIRRGYGVIGVVTDDTLSKYLGRGCIVERVVHVDINDPLGRVIRLVTRMNTPYILVSSGDELFFLHVGDLYRALIIELLSVGRG